MKILRICLFFALIFILCACGDVPAMSDGTESVNSDTETVSFEACSIGVIIGTERISVQKDITGEGYSLYLPSYAENIFWSLEEDTEINGKSVSNGESAEMLLASQNFSAGEALVKVMRSANLPSLFLISDDGSMDKIDSSDDHSYSSSGAFSLISSDGELLSAGRLKKIRGRGNATWYGTEKKPYQIELSAAQSLLGLAKAKKYVLLANYYDPSLLRNRLVFDMVQAIEGYSPSCRSVDLYAHGEYLGSYLLCEKIDIAENKIAIYDLESETEDLLLLDPDEYPRGGSLTGAEKGSSKWFETEIEPEDITGGYLLEVDYPERYPDEVSGFVTERGLPVVIKSPECASKAQVEYIKEFVCDFEDALYSENGYNDKGKHFSEYADVDSLIFRYLLEEFVLNIDGGISSFHIYKDREGNGGKLNFSCVWDYDCSLGNYDLYADLTSPEMLFVASSETRNNGTVPSWFNALLGHEDMAERISSYYAEAFRPMVLMMAESIEGFSSEIKASAEMDDALYGGLEKRNFYGAESGSSFEEAKAYLIDFVNRRIEFFDLHFGMND
ncbi:MAG: CotH kinase family protein [Clostridia bacterium]|nr:CotH kinase family protein [Clostridia bacterium]